MRAPEGTLHSAKRMVSKSKAQRMHVRGDGWRGREVARTVKVVTLETFHASRGWLKERASRKVSCTRQSEMVSKSEAQRVRVRGDGWRGREAARTSRVVTMLVSQPLISLLKLEQAGLQPRPVQYEPETAQKRYDKSVTCEIFHKFIGPYVAAAAVGLEHQARTAVCRAALLAKTLFWPAACLLYTSPSPRDATLSRMPSSA